MRNILVFPWNLLDRDFSFSSLSLFLFFSALSRRLLWWGMHARSRGCIFYEPRERTTQRRPNNRTSSYFRAKRENFDAKTHECHEFSRTDSIDFWLIFDGNQSSMAIYISPSISGEKDVTLLSSVSDSRVKISRYRYRNWIFRFHLFGVVVGRILFEMRRIKQTLKTKFTDE